MKATLQLWWPNFWEFFGLSIIGVIRFYAGRVLRLVLQLFLTFLYDKDLEQFGSSTVFCILLFCAWSFQLCKLVFSMKASSNVIEKMAKKINVLWKMMVTEAGFFLKFSYSLIWSSDVEIQVQI